MCCGVRGYCSLFEYNKVNIPNDEKAKRNKGNEYSADSRE